MQVTEVKGKDVICMIKNSATLAGPLYTLHVSQIRIELPTLTDKDKEVFVFNTTYCTNDDMTKCGHHQNHSMSTFSCLTQCVMSTSLQKSYSQACSAIPCAMCSHNFISIIGYKHLGCS